MHAALDRRAAVRHLLATRGGALVVSGLGSPSYDVHAAGDHPANYYLWGAMGGAALVGLGLAQAQPGRRVLVITGDGEMLMAMGALATIGAARPGNLDVVVLDNQHFGETGMQASHTGAGVDLAQVAAACGFARTGTVRDAAGLAALGETLSAPGGGPGFFVLKVQAVNLPRSLPLRDAVAVKTRFRAVLGLDPI